MKPKHKRLLFILFSIASIAAGVALIASHMKDNIIFFYSPTDLQQKTLPLDKTIRIGGLVKQQSITSIKAGTIEFIITDLEHEFKVQYTGIIPNLFREGQGVVAKGKINTNSKTLFMAEEILAKHDENYMPPEVAKSLKKSGHWQHYNNKTEKQ